MKIYRNSIILGDCTKIMAHMPEKSIDFILTDPPYLVNYVSWDGRTVPNDNNSASHLAI